MAKKGAGGRPTIMTDEVVQKLEYAFSIGCTDLEACCYADISKSTLYNYCNDNPEFLERKEVLKKNPVLKAREVVVHALDENDIATAHKVIERHDGTKTNVDLTSSDGSMSPKGNDLAAEMAKRILEQNDVSETD